jgi:phenolic acid decarboxylase
MAWLRDRQDDLAKLGEQVAKLKALLEPQGTSFAVEPLYGE